MAARVRGLLKSRRGQEITVHFLLNSGFETDAPEVLVPQMLAGLLGVWPRLPAETLVEEYETVGGKTRLFRLEGEVEVSVVGEERTGAAVRCHLVISEHEEEALLSDQAIGALRLVIEDAASGLWRFRDETILRPSVPPQLWSAG